MLNTTITTGVRAADQCGNYKGINRLWIDFKIMYSNVESLQLVRGIYKIK